MHTIRWIELNEKNNKTRTKCTGEDVYNEMYRTRVIEGDTENKMHKTICIQIFG